MILTEKTLASLFTGGRKSKQVRCRREELTPILFFDNVKTQLIEGGENDNYACEILLR